MFAIFKNMIDFYAFLTFLINEIVCEIIFVENEIKKHDNKT